MRAIKYIGTLILGLWALSAVATVENPVTLLQTSIANLQQDVAGHNASLASDPNQLYAIVKQNVMPLIDIERMAGMTLGPKWRSASQAEKNQFIDSFGLLMTRVYTSALLEVANYRITIYPMRNNNWQNQQQLIVRGQVTSGASNQASNIAYYMERSGDTWKIYDFAVEGVSVVKNYQSQFQSFPDMAIVLSKLQQLNQQFVSS